MPKVVWKSPESMGWTLISEFPEHGKQVWADLQGVHHILPKYAGIPVMVNEDGEDD